MLLLLVAYDLGEGAQELGDNVLQLVVAVIGDSTLLGNGGQQSRLVGLDVGKELLLESGDLGGVHFVEVTSHTAEDDDDLFEKIITRGFRQI